MPAINIFVPSEEYIEIDGFLIETEEPIEGGTEEGSEGETEGVGTEGEELAYENKAVPMTLEAIEPEMVASRSDVSAWDASRPERMFRLPESLEMTEAAERSRQEILPADIESVDREWAGSKEMPKPQPEISDVVLLQEKLEERHPDDVTSTVDLPPREIQVSQESIEPDVEPDFKTLTSVELPDQQETEISPKPVFLTRTFRTINSPRVEREFQQNTPSGPTMPRVQILEPKTLPKADEQETVPRETEKTLAMNVEVSLKNSSFREPEPDFQVRSFPELPTIQQEDTIPERVAMLRVPSRPTPIQIEREFPQHELSKPSKPRIELPESRSLPEPEQEEIVFEEEENALAMNVEMPLEDSFFDEPELDFQAHLFPELSEIQQENTVSSRVAMLRVPSRPISKFAEREFPQSESSKLIKPRIQLPESRELPEPDEQEIVFKEEENAFAMNAEVPLEDSHMNESELDDQPRLFPELPEIQQEDTIPARVAILRSPARLSPPPVEREFQHSELSKSAISAVRLPETKTFPQSDEEEMILDEDEHLLAMNAEGLVKDTPADESEPEFQHRSFPGLPEIQQEDTIPAKGVMLRDPSRPTAPTSMARFFQRNVQREPETLYTQLAKSKSLPELANDDSVVKAEENEADRFANIIDSPPVSSDTNIKAPDTQMPFPQKSLDIQVSKATLAKSEHTVRVESPVRPFSPMRTAKLSQEQSQEEKITPSFQNFSSLPILLPPLQLPKQTEELVITDNREGPIRTVPKVELIKGVKRSEPQSIAVLVRHKRVSPTSEEPDRVSTKIVSAASEKQYTPERKPLFLSPQVAYAEEETVAEMIQRPPSESSRSLSATSPVSFGIKKPKGLTLQQPASKLDTPIRLFEPKAAAVQRASVAERSGSAFPGRTDQTGWGLLLKKQKPILEFEEDSKELAEQEETLLETAVEEFEEGVTFEIEGPAAKREVIDKPPRFPEIELDREVSIQLKFWILPDGTVGEVVPLQRGDIRLERIATQYLKSWRFTPVSGDQEMWGIVPITYRLR